MDLKEEMVRAQKESGGPYMGHGGFVVGELVRVAIKVGVDATGDFPCSCGHAVRREGDFVFRVSAAILLRDDHSTSQRFQVQGVHLHSDNISVSHGQREVAASPDLSMVYEGLWTKTDFGYCYNGGQVVGWRRNSYVGGNVDDTSIGHQGGGIPGSAGGGNEGKFRHGEKTGER